MCAFWLKKRVSTFLLTNLHYIHILILILNYVLKYIVPFHSQSTHTHTHTHTHTYRTNAKIPSIDFQYEREREYSLVALGHKSCQHKKGLYIINNTLTPTASYIVVFYLQMSLGLEKTILVCTYKYFSC